MFTLFVWITTSQISEPLISPHSSVKDFGRVAEAEAFGVWERTI